METERHVEVFGDGGFGPPFGAVVEGTVILDGLEGVPAEDGVCGERG